jgi:hypothetical protein
MNHFPSVGPRIPFPLHRSTGSESDSAPSTTTHTASTTSAWNSINTLQERDSAPDSRSDREEADVGTVLAYAAIGCFAGFGCLAGKFLLKYGRRASFQKIANHTAERWGFPPVANAYMTSPDYRQAHYLSILPS